ncbi:MAG: hypothetical protein ACLTQI_02540 [Slackia sp.]
MFWRYMSHPFGGLVLDQATMIAVVYGIAMAVCVPFAAWAFRRHEVA